MTLQAECPRCASVVEQRGQSWTCPLHGEIAPLWRTASPDYDSFAAHLQQAAGMPTWAPWPLPHGWSVFDFGAVRGAEATRAEATVLTCGGLTESDGPVLLTVVTEEPGTGLGARVAEAVHDDPGSQMLGRPTQARARTGGIVVPLWLLSTHDEGEVASASPVPERAVLVGEARGRWLWLVISPVGAALGLDAWGALEDLGRCGPELVELPFAARPREW